MIRIIIYKIFLLIFLYSCTIISEPQELSKTEDKDTKINHKVTYEISGSNVQLEISYRDSSNGLKYLDYPELPCEVKFEVVSPYFIQITVWEKNGKGSFELKVIVDDKIIYKEGGSSLVSFRKWI